MFTCRHHWTTQVPIPRRQCRRCIPCLCCPIQKHPPTPVVPGPSQEPHPRTPLPHKPKEKSHNVPNTVPCLVPFAEPDLQQPQAHLLAPFARLLCQFNDLLLFEIPPSEALEHPFDDGLAVRRRILAPQVGSTCRTPEFRFPLCLLPAPQYLVATWSSGAMALNGL